MKAIEVAIIGKDPKAIHPIANAHQYAVTILAASGAKRVWRITEYEGEFEEIVVEPLLGTQVYESGRYTWQFDSVVRETDSILPIPLDGFVSLNFEPITVVGLTYRHEDGTYSHYVYLTEVHPYFEEIILQNLT